jgi:hypothetical protein
VANLRSDRNSNSSVECQDSMTALSSPESGRPHRLGDAEPLARLTDAARGVFAALVGVEHHAGNGPAPDGDRHGQRAVGQGRVVMGAEREPDDPA